nr:alpha/beta hydrolases superfamily protein [Tanacetum cinerariifolium]
MSLGKAFNVLVPRLPYDDRALFFKHFGQCLYFDSFYNGKVLEEEPNKNYFSLASVIPKYINACWEIIRSFILPYWKGKEYKEEHIERLYRLVIGLVIPGLAAHGCKDYVDVTRLGTDLAQTMVNMTKDEQVAMTTGSIDGFLDVLLNFNTQALLKDNIIAWIWRQRWYISKEFTPGFLRLAYEQDFDDSVLLPGISNYLISEKAIAIVQVKLQETSVHSSFANEESEVFELDPDTRRRVCNDSHGKCRTILSKLLSGGCKNSKSL